MFNIFIKDPYAKRFQKDEKITKTSFIANSGGLMGLCMGFSLISAAEILFHCVFGLFTVLLPGAKRRRARRESASLENELDESADENSCRCCGNELTASCNSCKTPAVCSGAAAVAISAGNGSEMTTFSNHTHELSLYRGHSRQTQSTPVSPPTAGLANSADGSLQLTPCDCGNANCHANAALNNGDTKLHIAPERII